MKIRSLVSASTLLLLIAFTGEGRAQALAGYSGVNLNIRSGPSARFPAVGRLAAGSSLAIHGCVARYTWCDVSASNVRGWVSGAYIQFVHETRRVYVPAYAEQAQIPVVTFNVSSYWRDNYHDYGFYGQIDSWSDYHWENDGNPPGWRNNWDDDHVDHEEEPVPDHD
jgi:uncharacterized protein YraI